MKSLAASVCHYLGLFRLARWVNRDRLLILTYHGVLPWAERRNGYLSRNVVAEDDFRWQMSYLTKAYHCLGLSDAVERLSAGRPLPRYSVVVTFDDGFRNNYLYAYPILKHHGIPATVFLTTAHIGRGTKPLWTERVGLLLSRTPKRAVTLDLDGTRVTLRLRTDGERAAATRRVLRALKALPVDRRDRVLQDLEVQAAVSDGDAGRDADRYAFLSWEEVLEMAGSGIEFGSHTEDHAILTSLPEEARAAEIVRSKEEIERRLERPCRLFAYPNGTPADFDERDKANLKAAGYLCALTQVPGFNGSGMDLFELRRVNIGRGHRGLMFVAQFSGFWLWLRRLRDRLGAGAPA